MQEFSGCLLRTAGAHKWTGPPSKTTDVIQDTDGPWSWTCGVLPTRGPPRPTH